MALPLILFFSNLKQKISYIYFDHILYPPLIPSSFSPTCLSTQLNVLSLSQFLQHIQERKSRQKQINKPNKSKNTTPQKSVQQTPGVHSFVGMGPALEYGEN